MAQAEAVGMRICRDIQSYDDLSLEMTGHSPAAVTALFGHGENSLVFDTENILNKY